MASALLLSPRRYLAAGYGLALPSGYTFSQLRSTLVRAQDAVTRYCNAPKQPSAFDWRGGVMEDEQHQWKWVDPLAYGPGARRVYVNAGPIKAVSALTLDLGKTYVVSINPASDIYVNSIEQYVEVVAINPTIVGFYPLNVNLGLYNPVARISYSYGWSFDVTGDQLESEDPTLYSAAYGNWDPDVAPVVEVAGVEVDPGDYTVNYDDGTVEFATAPSPGQLVEASYTYLAPSPVVDAIGYTATKMLGETRMNARGMAGLSSLKVAEVSLTRMQPQSVAQRNGVSIPLEAADLLGGFVFGSALA